VGTCQFRNLSSSAPRASPDLEGPDESLL
jgi:hypothetical protein